MNKIYFFLFSFFLTISLFAAPFQQKEDPVFNKYNSRRPKYVRGIHVTGWAAGSSKFRPRIDNIVKKTEINTVVICVKEADGEVYIPGVPKAEEISAYKPAIKDLKEYISHLQNLGVYVVARITLFKDPILAEAEYYWAVHDKKGKIWRDYKGVSWVDPFNKRDVWPYLFEISDRCVELGFDELQFDYVRFPSDGKISDCRYLIEYSSKTAVAVLVDFLKEAKKRYKDKQGIFISVDTFGLTTSADTDLGIGQDIVAMEPYVDAISPMVYPSHYSKGTYGIVDPDKDPYKTVFMALKYGKEKLGDKSYKLRAYLQDFSLQNNYGAKEVRAQIKACYDNGLYEWILWNAAVKYTFDALESKN